MRTIVLTRPHPVYDGVAGDLVAQGYAVLDLPTLSVVANIDHSFESTLPRHWSTYDGAMFVSQHAVRFAAQRLSALSLDWRRNLWAASVGGATADAIRVVFPNAPIVLPDADAAHDSVGLWAAMQSKFDSQQLKTARILVVRAQIGRDFLLNQLTSAGATVDVWACYRREVLVWSDAQREGFKTALAKSGLVLSITSAEGLLALLSNCLTLSDLEQRELRQQPVITLHHSIAQVATTQGFERVHVRAPAEMGAVLGHHARLLA